MHFVLFTQSCEGLGVTPRTLPRDVLSRLHSFVVDHVQIEDHRDVFVIPGPQQFQELAGIT